MSSDSGQAIALPLDGERFVPDEMHGNIELEHRHRYLFASQFVSGKAVLDIASGEGYGSALLAKSARRVIGVDIAESAVEHANQRYRTENLEFVTGSCATIPLDEGAVDVVVSFETIEHHTEHEAMMREVKRVLRPGGLLVISSPDKLEYSDKPSYQNPFHVKELYREEFQTLLSTHFRNVRLFGQRVVLGSMLVGEQPSKRIWFQRHERELTPAPGDLEPVYWVAMASDDPLPIASDSVYEQPTAAFWGKVDQQRNSTITKLIAVIAAPGSEQLRSCLQSEWYLQQNADVVAAGVDPYEHWIATGVQEGRLPSSEPLSLVEELLREREQLQQQSFHTRQERLIQTRQQLEPELAERERLVAEQLDQQQAGFNAERVALTEAAGQKLAALIAENAERERLLRLEVESLQEQLEHTQNHSQEIREQSQKEAQERVQRAQREMLEQRISLQEELAQARREALVQLESHLQRSAQRDEAFAVQILQQQEKFHGEHAALSQAMEQRLVAQAEEHIERERRLRQDVQGLQDRLQQTQRESQERLEQAQMQSDEQRAALQEELTRARLETGEQVKSLLRQLADRERSSAEQFAQQQARFDDQRTALDALAEREFQTLAAEHADRERRLRQDLHSLQEHMKAKAAAETELLQNHCTRALLDLNNQLTALRSTWSWRLTAPLRSLSETFGTKSQYADLHSPPKEDQSVKDE